MTSPRPMAAGTRLACSHCLAQFTVIRPPTSPVRITCGPREMHVLLPTEPRPFVYAVPKSIAVDVGRHYHDSESGLEVLCTHSGAGIIAVDGRALRVNHVIST